LISVYITAASQDVAAPRRYSHPDDSTPPLPGRGTVAYDRVDFTAATTVVADIAPTTTSTTAT